VFVRDAKGRTWAPIVVAGGDQDLRVKVETLYPQSTWLEARPIHEASEHHDFGRAYREALDGRAGRAAA
jgi:hypothetical protein